MSNRKISDLSLSTAPATDDLLLIVDVSEPSLADQNKKVACQDIARALVAQSVASGVTYTFAEADNARIVKLNNASGIVATVPSGLSTNFSCMVIQTGSGVITFSGAAGVTLRSPLNANKTAYQYATASLIALSTNEFLLTGDVTA